MAKKDGITLIALIVTIVLLSILAGVSISSINEFKIHDVAEKYSQAVEEEKNKLNSYSNMIAEETIPEDKYDYNSNNIMDFTPIASRDSSSISIGVPEIETNNVDIIGYIYLLNGKVVSYTEEKQIKLTEFETSSEYITEVIAIDENGQYKKSYKKRINMVLKNEYPAIGQVKPVLIEKTGRYKLEVWGAQGYCVSNKIGGYGGYSVGECNLNAGEYIYISVGEQGKGGMSTNYTAFPNAGPGGAGDSLSYAGCGGGATYIIKDNKELEKYSSDYSTKVLIVAGGGGSSTYSGPGNWYGNGGHAGGYKGKNGDGNNYTAGGGATENGGGTAGHSSTAGAFGRGNKKATMNASGGGGFYGGGGSWGAGGGRRYRIYWKRSINKCIHGWV